MMTSLSNEYIQYQCFSCREQCTTLIPNENREQFLKDIVDPNKHKLCNDCWDAFQVMLRLGYLNEDVKES